MANVRVGDIDVHYTERGSGPPMVLVHGGLATSEIMWSDEHVARVAEHHRVLMPDSRGHGRTTNPRPELSYPQMADDLAGFCAALGLSKPVIVGYSDGAQIGIELGLRHPEVARAIVLGGVVTGPSPAYFEMLAAMGFTRAGEVDLDRMRAAFGEPLFTTMVQEAHASWRTFVDQISRLWMTLPSYSHEQLGRIVTPCLVICGDRDQTALDQGVPLSRALPTAELAVVPGSGHGAATRSVFWANVLDFLTRH